MSAKRNGSSEPSRRRTAEAQKSWSNGQQPAEAAALHTSEGRLRAVVAHAPIVLFSINTVGIFTLSVG